MRSSSIVTLAVDLVQTSCGYGVPLFDFVGERDTLARWALAKGGDGLAAYRRERNARSIDGLPTGSGNDTDMEHDEKHFPGDASREGLRELDERKHHETTEHTAASHPRKAEFDETASEVHRAGNPPYEKA